MTCWPTWPDCEAHRETDGSRYCIPACYQYPKCGTGPLFEDRQRPPGTGQLVDVLGQLFGSPLLTAGADHARQCEPPAGALDVPDERSQHRGNHAIDRRWRDVRDRAAERGHGPRSAHRPAALDLAAGATAGFEDYRIWPRQP